MATQQTPGSRYVRYCTIGTAPHPRPSAAPVVAEMKSSVHTSFRKMRLACEAETTNGEAQRRRAIMGQSSSKQPFENSTDAQHLGFGPGAALPPLAAWGDAAAASDGYDTDSDVEYDIESQSRPSPAPAWDDLSTRRDDTNRWGAAAVPSWAADGAADEPCSSRLDLQFVYGTRGADCRNNIFFLPTGEIAFHAAALVVVHDPRRHAQRFLRGHDAEVRCLAVHPRGSALASGQAAGGATEICIWQLDASEPAMVLSGPHASGVALLSFSPDGERLASVGADAEHTLVIWDWRQGTVLKKHAAHREALFGLAWSPSNPAQTLATVGLGFVRLWSLDATGVLTPREAELRPARPGTTLA